MASGTGDGAAAKLLDPSLVHTELTGCLAQADGKPTRAMPIEPPGSGAEIELLGTEKPKLVHHLAHACCLSAKTHAELGPASTVTVVEQLSGSPCRCQCRSTLSTELTLTPGSYVLAVVVAQAGAAGEAEKRREVFRRPFEVKAASAGSGAPPTLKPPHAIHVPAAGH